MAGMMRDRWGWGGVDGSELEMKLFVTPSAGCKANVGCTRQALARPNKLT